MVTRYKVSTTCFTWKGNINWRHACEFYTVIKWNVTKCAPLWSNNHNSITDWKNKLKFTLDAGENVNAISSNCSLVVNYPTNVMKLEVVQFFLGVMWSSVLFYTSKNSSYNKVVYVIWQLLTWLPYYFSFIQVSPLTLEILLRVTWEASLFRGTLLGNKHNMHVHNNTAGVARQPFPS
jgi:hypothetical protein